MKRQHIAGIYASPETFGGQSLTVRRKAMEGGWLFAVLHPDGKQAALAQLLVQPE